ncbi:putative esterase LipW [Lentilactobacillus fungorum]|uniref:Esterase LipW n=1 Tax=Lentilactobacillus fungorum TaxID=2201250 RepID=A0ABQ3W0M3_9LACO|nr:alpha/beta hydrolase [Lentilactobacillus fungorum]GHP14241.1 putative esterase LipW [Lentilactobacillus fungorum]
MYVTKEMIHPELRKFVPLHMNRILHSQKSVKFLNAAIHFGSQGINLTDDINFEQHFIPRSNGTNLRICVYTPQRLKKDVPGILYIHGGGYAIGIPEIESQTIRGIIKRTGAVVVAPDYRLSLEEPYPAALNDCYLALRWLSNNGSQYGMRSDQIMVGGESAGGGLTAALSVYARDQHEIAIAFQMPLYPMLDDRNNSKSAQNSNAPVWDQKANELGWKLYLGNLYQQNNIPEYAVPSRTTDYSNLPPTCTFVGDIEVFYDETVTYINQLKANGVPTHFKVFPGCFHAFNLLSPNSTPGRKANQYILDMVDFAAKNYFAKQP